MSLDVSKWDALYRAGTKVSQVMAFAELLSPVFLERKGGVFLDEMFDEDTFSKQYNGSKGDIQKTEQAINCVDFTDMFEIDVSDEEFHEIVSFLAKSWGNALSSRFPNRQFDVEVVDFSGDGAWGIILSQTPSPKDKGS